jgi:hypothetical protein
MVAAEYDSEWLIEDEELTTGAESFLCWWSASAPRELMGGTAAAGQGRDKRDWGDLIQKL